MPTISIHAVTLGGSREAMMSMRTCAFLSITYPALSRKTAEKRYHWISSQALLLRLSP